ncbi:uncharacterized protein LOC143174435 [Nomia melanderi]|uniref:uncharacterized protein LOC143174435 n=1 Tax=Nomia melanderi TaxID=2448451 RepID=UPI003FCCCC77
MSLRKPRKRRRRRRVLPIRQINKRKSVPAFSEHRLNDHFYETRSKSTRNAVSETVLIDSTILSSRSSSSSVVCLGSYRKIPELVNLEDNCDNSEAKACKQEMKTSRPQKMEPIKIKSLVK